VDNACTPIVASIKWGPVQRAEVNEVQLLRAFERGKLVSIATKSEIERLKGAARATAIKNRRVNIRLSSIDLRDIQTRALEEGMPFRARHADVWRNVGGRISKAGLGVQAQRACLSYATSVSQ